MSPTLPHGKALPKICRARRRFCTTPRERPCTGENGPALPFLAGGMERKNGSSRFFKALKNGSKENTRKCLPLKGKASLAALSLLKVS